MSSRPHLALLHYTAPPIVGGVEAILAHHARLLTAAGYRITIIAGRGGTTDLPRSARVVIIPEMDSAHPENLAIAAALDRGETPAAFFALRNQIEEALSSVLADVDVAVAHNIMTMHFNLPLTAAMHRLVDQGIVRQLIVWCHDLSRHVNPQSGVALHFGYPWDLLRTRRPEFSYVAISASRQRLLANIFGCAQHPIHVISNGVDPSLLLGLSDLGQHLADAFGLLSADLILLMPVRITRAKNIEYALRVTAALKIAGTQPRLVVTGPPDPHSPDIQSYYAELQALRRTLDLDEEAIFIHEGTRNYARPLRLAQAVVFELYRVCDLVLMPSHREGFGLPILEAGFVDRPVFTTSVPAIEDIGEVFPYLIKADESPEAVAARIRVWAEQDIAHRLRRRFRKTYAWPSIFTRCIEPLIMGMTNHTAGKAV